jgi:drug/metabolite transporter (DMT)-like permease
MTLFPFVLAATAAVLHATWNLIVKSSGDRLIGAWTVSAGAAALYVAVLAVVGLPDRRVWGLVSASIVIQTIYMVVLATAYSAGDLSFVYPVARGSAPLLVTAIGAVALGDHVTPLGVAGVVVVTGAIALLAASRPSRLGFGWALATGATIATYLLIDTASVRIQGNALPVIAAVFVGHGILLTATVALMRNGKEMMDAVRSNPRRMALGGFGSAAGYLLVMVATLFAPAGLVVSVRESSVLLGVAAGKTILGEVVSPAQFTAVGLAVLGVVMVALS